jgi:hypothetical protein
MVEGTFNCEDMLSANAVAMQHSSAMCQCLLICVERLEDQVSIVVPPSVRTTNFYVEHAKCGSQQWQATQVYFYILIQVLYYLTFGDGLRGWWSLLVSGTLGERAIEEERTSLIYVIIYMPLYTLRAVHTDHFWSCLATTRLKTSHDSISHGAHDPGHLRCYPATSVRFICSGRGYRTHPCMHC